jgi:hypothetical protein
VNAETGKNRPAIDEFLGDGMNPYDVRGQYSRLSIHAGINPKITMSGLIGTHRT